MHAICNKLVTSILLFTFLFVITADHKYHIYINIVFDHLPPKLKNINCFLSLVNNLILMNNLLCHCVLQVTTFSIADQ